MRNLSRWMAAACVAASVGVFAQQPKVVAPPSPAAAKGVKPWVEPGTPGVFLTARSKNVVLAGSPVVGIVLTPPEQLVLPRGTTQ